MKPRIIETTKGIQGEINVATYDKMQRHLRDKGWIGTDKIIESGIKSGFACEIGPGPGYLGLEWLKQTHDTQLKCVEISGDMIEVAGKNAREYNLTGRIEYKQGMAEAIPFDDNSFDGVFSNGSLHEWKDPERVFDEIHRVLKPGGRFYISDLKRNMNPLAVSFLKTIARPKEIRPGLISSINASYTIEEIVGVLNKTQLKSAETSENMIGIEIKGFKQVPISY